MKARQSPSTASILLLGLLLMESSFLILSPASVKQAIASSDQAEALHLPTVSFTGNPSQKAIQGKMDSLLVCFSKQITAENYVKVGLGLNCSTQREPHECNGDGTGHLCYGE